MLIGAEVFLHAVYTFRNVWIGGRYGGGKTLLAVALADTLAKKYDFDTYSNAPVNLPSSVEHMTTCNGDSPACDKQCQAMIELTGKGKHHTTVIYDEAWMALGAGTSPKQIKAYMAYLRKMDVVLLMPSVLPMAKNSYLLQCERLFNFGVFGIPIWLYHWWIAGKNPKKDGGKFMLVHPQKYFGQYETVALPRELEHLFEGQG